MPAPVAADVHGNARLRRQLRPAPGDHVVLQRAGAAVVGDRAVLQRDAAAVGEEPLVQRTQLVGAAVDVGVARRLAQRAVRLERGEDGVDVAGGERALVVADHVGQGEVVDRLEQRRAVRVAAGQRPGGEVQPQLDDALVLVVVGRERHRKADAPAVGVDVDDDLLEPARMRDQEVDVLDVDVALRHPGPGVGGIAPERGLAPDPPAHRMVHLGHAGERLDERVDLTGHQPVEERHRAHALALVLLEDLLERGSGEQLGRPGHATSIPRRTYRVSARRSRPGQA